MSKNGLTVLTRPEQLDGTKLNVPDVNYMSQTRREQLIEKYLRIVGMNRAQFVAAWLDGTVEDSYEANRLSSFLVR